MQSIPSANAVGAFDSRNTPKPRAFRRAISAQLSSMAGRVTYQSRKNRRTFSASRSGSSRPVSAA